MSGGRTWIGAVVLAVLLVSTAQAGLYDAAVLSDNPVAYWRFEDSSTAVDSSTNATVTDGTYQLINFAPNSFHPNLGQAAEWHQSPNNNDPGGRSFVDFGSPGAGDLKQLTNVDAGGPPAGDPDPNRKTSLEFWIKTTQTGSHGDNWRASLVFGRESGGDGDIHWGYMRPGGEISLAVNDDNHRHHETASPITDDAWHHIVFNYDWATRTSELYVDGAFESNFTGGTNIFQDGDAMVQYMGWNDTTDQPATFLGQLDEVAIYNDLLSANQVAAHFEAATAAPADDIPEPATLALCLVGLSGLGLRLRRRLRRN